MVLPICAEMSSIWLNAWTINANLLLIPPKDEAHSDATQDATSLPKASEPSPDQQPIEHPHPRLNRTHIFNRSKFLDIEDHDRLIQYITSKNVIDTVSNSEPHKRVSLLRRLIFDNLKLSISMHMNQKLLNIHMLINAAKITVSPSRPDPDVEIDTTDF